MIHLMDLNQRYHLSKGVQVCRHEDGAMGNLAPPGDREESASHHFTNIMFLMISMVRRLKSCVLELFKSADLLSVCLDCSLPGGFTLLKWFPLRPPRTYFVSLDKTKHSSAEVLISGTLRGWGWVRPQGAHDYRSTKQVLSAPA